MVEFNITKDFWTVGYNMKDKETYIKITLRELLFFIWFLIISSLMIILMISPSMYYFTRAVENIFINMEFSSFNGVDISFNDIQTAADFWKYAEQILVDNLYWEYWYGYEDQIAPTTSDDRNILYENKLLGAPRLTQFRVKNDSCYVNRHFQDMFSTCYGSYSESNKQDEDLPKKSNSSEGSEDDTAWRYSPDASYMSYAGLMATYGTGGYYIDLGLERNQTADQINDLEHNLWITRNTRAILLDFTIYNANINLFCVCK